jgi:hypothetical protein
MAPAFIRLKAEHRFSIFLAQDDELARVDQVRVVHGRVCFPGLGSAPWLGQKQPGEVPEGIILQHPVPLQRGRSPFGCLGCAGPELTSKA